MNRPVPNRRRRADDQSQDRDQRDVAQHEIDDLVRGSAPSAMRIPISLRRRVTSVRHHAVKPECREQQSESAEKPRERCDQPLLQHVGAEILVEPFEIDGDVLVDGADRLHDGVARIEMAPGRADDNARAQTELALLGRARRT